VLFLFLSPDHDFGESADGLLFHANLDVQQFPPDISGLRLAKVELVLSVGLHCLHIVEDQRESDQTAGDGDSAEHDCAESHRLQRGLLFFVLHLSYNKAGSNC
jgi:hypothetical protein